jgi:hypothetical protein
MIKGRLKATPFRRPTVKLCAGQIGILGVERIQARRCSAGANNRNSLVSVSRYFTVRTAIASASV